MKPWHPILLSVREKKSGNILGLDVPATGASVLCNVTKAKDNRHVITGETFTCNSLIVIVVNLLTGECFILTSSFELHFVDQTSKPNVQSLLIPNLLYLFS